MAKTRRKTAPVAKIVHDNVHKRKPALIERDGNLLLLHCGDSLWALQIWEVPPAAERLLREMVKAYNKEIEA